MEEAKKTIINFFVNYGKDVAGALIILAVGILVARWIGKVLERWLERIQMEPPVRLLLVRVARLLIIAFTALAVLEKFGVPTTSAIAGIGVAGIGVGLAMQGVLSNIVAGLTIIFTKPFRVGDYIELIGVQGQVKTIELFSTTLLHADLSRVVIPNRKIVGEVLHNYGTIRQLDLSVGIAYSSDLNKVLNIVGDIVRQNPRVLKDPSPALGVKLLADSSITIAVKPWTTVPDYGPAGAEIYQAIIERFRANQIEIPFPQQEVRLLNNAPMAA
ncbi:MAG: mechanosensitive ion channel [Verrucomicrobia bacterium]|nr:mechanosensitive ion channel [Verrucomicrobiota bacterium]